MSYDPVVKPVTCPSCQKQANVRVLTGSTHVTYQCPSCHKIQKASVGG
jgi:hypothetical protein